MSHHVAAAGLATAAVVATGGAAFAGVVIENVGEVGVSVLMGVAKRTFQFGKDSLNSREAKEEMRYMLSLLCAQENQFNALLRVLKQLDENKVQDPMVQDAIRRFTKGRLNENGESPVQELQGKLQSHDKDVWWWGRNRKKHCERYLEHLRIMQSAKEVVKEQCETARLEDHATDKLKTESLAASTGTPAAVNTFAPSPAAAYDRLMSAVLLGKLRKLAVDAKVLAAEHSRRRDNMERLERELYCAQRDLQGCEDVYWARCRQALTNRLNEARDSLHALSLLQPPQERAELQAQVQQLIQNLEQLLSTSRPAMESLPANVQQDVADQSASLDNQRNRVDHLQGQLNQLQATAVSVRSQFHLVYSAGGGDNESAPETKTDGDTNDSGESAGADENAAAGTAETPEGQGEGASEGAGGVRTPPAQITIRQLLDTVNELASTFTEETNAGIHACLLEFVKLDEENGVFEGNLAPTVQMLLDECSAALNTSVIPYPSDYVPTGLQDTLNQILIQEHDISNRQEEATKREAELAEQRARNLLAASGLSLPASAGTVGGAQPAQDGENKSG